MYHNCNCERSWLYDIRDALQYTLYTCAGPEIAVASTKAYTTQFVLLTLLALCSAADEITG